MQIKTYIKTYVIFQIENNNTILKAGDIQKALNIDDGHMQEISEVMWDVWKERGCKILSLPRVNPSPTKKDPLIIEKERQYRDNIVATHGSNLNGIPPTRWNDKGQLDPNNLLNWIEGSNICIEYPKMEIKKVSFIRYKNPPSFRNENKKDKSGDNIEMRNHSDTIKLPEDDE